jgi:hypothetical protein
VDIHKVHRPLRHAKITATTRHLSDADLADAVNEAFPDLSSPYGPRSSG